MDDAASKRGRATASDEIHDDLDDLDDLEGLPEDPATGSTPSDPTAEASGLPPGGTDPMGGTAPTS